VIIDLAVLVDSRMTVSKSTRMLGFIERISREDAVCGFWQGLEYTSCVWSPHQEVHSARIRHTQHNFIRFAL
jgi:hypothetical protein